MPEGMTWSGGSFFVCENSNSKPMQTKARRNTHVKKGCQLKGKGADRVEAYPSIAELWHIPPPGKDVSQSYNIWAARCIVVVALCVCCFTELNALSGTVEQGPRSSRICEIAVIFYRLVLIKSDCCSGLVAAADPAAALPPSRRLSWSAHLVVSGTDVPIQAAVKHA